MQPYLSLCVIFRDNASTIQALLNSVDGHFDEYVFCDTGSKDGARDILAKFLETRPGRIVDFEWCDDFAAARQCSFEAATGRWRMFLDTDDQLVHGERLKPFLLQCELHHPQMEGIFIGYDYAQNEFLDTMRLCRWRDGWRWRDHIHERLEFDGPPSLPFESFGRTHDIIVKHVYKTDEDKIRAIRRNGVIARREYERTTDAKYKARLARTIAMEFKMDGQNDKAIPYLEELYKPYRTYPEGRQAAADLMKAHLVAGDFDKALEWAKKAGPSYEAIAHHARKEYREALKACQRGVGRGQQATHEGLLFEKGAAFVAAADSAIQGDVPRKYDVAGHLINQIPAQFRNDRLLLPSVQVVRSLVDRITILVPGTPQPFDEHGGGGMLGGSEEAVLYLTEALVGLGRNVRIYAPLPPQRIPGPDAIGRDWQDIRSFDADAEHGTLVVWRSWQVAANLLEARTKGKPMPGIMSCWMWLHDTHCGVQPEIMGPLSQAVTGAITLSDFHTAALREQGYVGSVVKLSNGIVEADFEPWIETPPFGLESEENKSAATMAYYGGYRDPNRVVYSSDPSRGLVPLLEMWPDVKKECPDAYLDIYYDWSMVEAMQPENYSRIMTAYEAVKHLDVVHHGGVDHQTLHDALRKANVWAYSHFESPMSETFCISAIKAQACGATVLSVPNGALREVTAGDALLTEDFEVYKDSLIRLLKEPQPVESRREVAHRALKRYGWKTVAKGFSDLWRMAYVPPAANAPVTKSRLLPKEGEFVFAPAPASP